MAPVAATAHASAPADAPGSAAILDTARGGPTRRVDVLVAIRDAASVVVPGRDGLPVAFRVGQQLPSGARLLSVDSRLGTAETDRGPMRLE